MAVIRLDEWKREFERLMTRAPESEGMSMRELMEACGKSRTEVLTHLHDLDKEGRLRVADKPIRNIAGKLTRVPSYVLLPPQKKQKKG